MKKTIFLDRDGTIIIDKIYLNDPKEIHYLPGVFQALRQFRDHGYTFVIVTNQSGVARGSVELKNLHKIHEVIRGDFAREGIDFLGFYYAPFLPASNHPLRKPNAGMLRYAAADHNINLKKSWMIGDRMSDVEAGHRAGTRTILISGTEKPEDFDFDPPEFIVLNLLEAAKKILGPH